VLATALYGRQAGLAVTAMLVPHPRSAHAVDNLRAAIAAGLDAQPTSASGLAARLARTLGRGDYWVAPGGSNVEGALGYAEAATEIAGQIKNGCMPEPDLIVVALGSGGTAAGLVAGLASEGLATTVLGVRVVHPWLAGKLRTVALAALVARRAGARVSAASLAERLHIETRFAGPGYGLRSADGDRAADLAGRAGLVLEPTYTAKAFAAALGRVAQGRQKNVLFWHTFSSAPFAPLLDRAPSEVDLPAGLRKLFTTPRG
jgi:D-cysteine desulfhydrase